MQEKISKGLATLASQSVTPDSAIWQTAESKALEVLVLDRLAPQFGGLRELR